VTFGSLFAGIGGIDLGLERAGLRCSWQVERNTECRKLLTSRWSVPLYADITTSYQSIPYADVLAGGDPCPKHSRARSNGDSKSPDLSGYFLAMAGRLRPWWVVRENVPAPTVDHFAIALECLGYGTVIIRFDSAETTGQSRQRDWIVGQRQATGASLRHLFQECTDGPGRYTTRLGTRQIVPALTTHRTRYDSRDCYVWEERGLRILDGDEREAFAGFPAGWTAGLSEATRARMCGNAADPSIAAWIGQAFRRDLSNATGNLLSA
jgi:DNA (cytosine-5)-methyltransferase 1